MKPGPPRLGGMDRGNAALQCTDKLGAQVALLQSPIPPAVTTSLIKSRSSLKQRNHEN